MINYFNFFSTNLNYINELIYMYQEEFLESLYHKSITYNNLSFM